MFIGYVYLPLKFKTKQSACQISLLKCSIYSSGIRIELQTIVLSEMPVEISACS